MIDPRACRFSLSGAIAHVRVTTLFGGVETAALIRRALAGDLESTA